MLDFYEAFQKCDIPPSLKNECYDSAAVPLSFIDELNKVNIFIGANNSGKSKLLREILRSKRDFYYSNKKAVEITNYVSDINGKVSRIWSKIGKHKTFLNHDSYGIFNFEEFQKAIEPFLHVGANYEANMLNQALERFFSKDFKKFPPDNIRSQGSGSGNTALEWQLANEILEDLNEIKNLVLKGSKFISNQQFPQIARVTNVYIPSIRTLRPFAGRSNIAEETKKEYGFDESVEIYNGLTMPREIQKLKNSNYVDREKIKSFEKFLSQEFFDNNLVELTVPINTDLINIKIGQEKEQPIHNLGDGLQMLIIITFPFFNSFKSKEFSNIFVVALQSHIGRCKSN